MSKGLKMINEIAGLMSKTHSKSRAALEPNKGHGLGKKPGSDPASPEAGDELEHEVPMAGPGDDGQNDSPSVEGIDAPRKAKSPIPPVKNSHGISGKSPAKGHRKY